MATAPTKDEPDEHIMYYVHQHGKTPAEAARGTIGRTRVFRLVAALGLAITLGLSIMPTADSARASRPPIAAAAPASVDPSRFILNALLVPALDADAVPLRWVDPRPALRCGPDTTVRVNGERLVAGELVPDGPFELQWQSDACRPFGAHGPRFDGWIQLAVYREDWGFSAMVEPSNLQVATGDAPRRRHLYPSHDRTENPRPPLTAVSESTFIQPGAASLPQCIDTGEPYELTIGADPSPSCR